MKRSENIKLIDQRGVLIGLSIIILWWANLIWGIYRPLDFSHPFTYLQFLLQIHLCTGLFITAHDAMHRTVSPNLRINNLIGQLCAFLYAFFPFSKLREKHHLHHDQVATEHDPDYHNGGFWLWYFTFIKRYISVWQIVAFAVGFNLLKLGLPAGNLIWFWLIPPVLSTLQLFYFGTYIPHRGEHELDNEHKARSQSKNHFWAFISCYFFGYHYEHHDKPYIPWWKLWRER